MTLTIELTPEEEAKITQSAAHMGMSLTDFAKNLLESVTLPEIDSNVTQWKYLAPRPGSWKRQLFVKGRRLTAANVWYDMQANRQTQEQAAEDWELPIEAVAEIVRYCETDRALIGMESDEEKRILIENGIALEPRKLEPEKAA